MTPEELASLTAVQTVAAVRTGAVTPRTVAEEAIARIEARDPRLHAVDVIRRDEALDDAALVDTTAPLAGVPVLVKAENDIAGLVTTYGGAAASRPASTDSEVVRRLRAAGAVVVGTTHMSEFGAFPFTEGRHGCTRNPHAPAHSPGGSSGGSAAAVAAGFVPVAVGGDGGGSIRIPASCCGVIGLKPVRGRVSAAPHADLWGALGTIGAITRTVTDTALVYDVLAGATAADRHRAAPVLGSFAEAAGAEPGRLRVAAFIRPPVSGVRLDPEVRAALIHTAERLEREGHRVDRLDRRWPNAQFSFVPQFATALTNERRRVDHPERVEPRTRTLARWGAAIAPARPAVERLGRRLAAQIEAGFAGYDVVLSPTLACLPPALPRLSGAGAVRAMLRAAPMIAFTTLANVTGHAAISVPAGRSRGGLPIGVQLYAPGGDEQRLLPLAAQLERGAASPGAG